MIKPYLLSWLLVGTIPLVAQPRYFIAIDADDARPFTVTIGTKNYVSDPYGHLVISPLKDTLHVLLISFPKSTFPSQRFEVELHHRDRGFSLKRFNEKNYVLQDWQGGEALQNGVSRPLPGPQPHSVQPAANAFALLMAAVVNDTGFIIAQGMAEAAIPGAAVPAFNTASMSREPAGTVSPKASPRVKEQARKPASVQHYLDSSESGVDTVEVIIMPDRDSLVDKGAAAKPDSSLAQNANAKGGKPLKDLRKVVAPSGVGSRCAQPANAAAIDKLRVQLLAEGTDEGRVARAQKFYERNCVSTIQVRALSELFFTDESRLGFFHVSYPYVIDPQRYAALEKFLTDPQVRVRFREMLR